MIIVGYEGMQLINVNNFFYVKTDLISKLVNGLSLCAWECISVNIEKNNILSSSALMGTQYMIMYIKWDYSYHDEKWFLDSLNIFPFKLYKLSRCMLQQDNHNEQCFNGMVINL